jgi:hypothetical protein|tara:strand:- start:321 stop:932 length:612 start_codon:yes stop_codon:yes gene_type:complete
MIDKKQIQNIKTNIERTIQGLVAKPKEFTYKETGGFVRNKMTYSIYYTLNKDEVYLTGTTDSTNSQIIEKVNDKTMFSEYKDLASLTRTPYPKTTPAKPTESDYEIGEITRYFTQVANDETKPIFEISAKDFGNQNSLYRYTEFQWRISGTKEEVTRDNQITIYDLELEYKDISKKLFPLQLWKPTRDSYEDVQKKLLLLKTD